MLNRLRGDDSGIITVKVNPNSSAPTHYDGDRGFKYLEGFPNCGNASVHNYLLFALKHLLRLGRKDDIKTDLKKAITYLARAIYTLDPASFNPDEIGASFRDWR
jgi:hypothetical protein